MTATKLGVLLWSQATDWPSFEASARRVDALGYDSLWAWDHLYAIFGDPYQPRGGGEKKTLRTVARHADIWNVMGSTGPLRHKVEVLHRHCEEVGRDPAGIELTAGGKPLIRNTAEEARRVWEAQMAHNRTPMANVIHDDTFWVGTPDLIAERKAIGFHTFLAEMAAPFDDETFERWIHEVVPMVDGG